MTAATAGRRKDRATEEERRSSGRALSACIPSARAPAGWNLLKWSREALERTGMRERKKEIARLVGQVAQNKGRQQSSAGQPWTLPLTLVSVASCGSVLILARLLLECSRRALSRLQVAASGREWSGAEIGAHTSRSLLPLKAGDRSVPGTSQPCQSCGTGTLSGLCSLSPSPSPSPSSSPSSSPLLAAK